MSTLIITDFLPGLTIKKVTFEDHSVVERK